MRVTASRDIERGGSFGGCNRNPDRLTRKEGDRRRRIVEFFSVGLRRIGSGVSEAVVGSCCVFFLALFWVWEF